MEKPSDSCAAVAAVTVSRRRPSTKKRSLTQNVSSRGPWPSTGRANKAVSARLGLAAPALTILVGDHGADDDQALDDFLIVGANVEEGEARGQDAQDHRADHRAGHAPDTGRRARCRQSPAAAIASSSKPTPTPACPLIERAVWTMPGESRQHRGERVDHHGVTLDIDARDARGERIGANGVSELAVAGIAKQDV